VAMGGSFDPRGSFALTLRRLLDWPSVRLINADVDASGMVTAAVPSGAWWFICGVDVTVRPAHYERSVEAGRAATLVIGQRSIGRIGRSDFSYNVATSGTLVAVHLPSEFRDATVHLHGWSVTEAMLFGGK